jgi:hypothetical protein
MGAPPPSSGAFPESVTKRILRLMGSAWTIPEELDALAREAGVVPEGVPELTRWLEWARKQGSWSETRTR